MSTRPRLERQEQEEAVVERPLIYVEGPSLDLAFKGITQCEDMGQEINIYFPNLERPMSEVRLITNVVKLNNNSLRNITGFGSVLGGFIYDLTNISWIDLSFNNLTTIDKELTYFHNLKMLYLHGNRISNLAEVDKLSAVGGTLIKITMHGNSVEALPNYREYILAHLPKLKMLDFSGVTHADRVKMRQFASAMERKNAKNRRRRRY